MTVARAAYTDLTVLNLTLSATTVPNTTQVPKLMTQLYKHAYRAIHGTYAAYDAADEHPIIDTEEVKSIIIAEAEDIVNAWHYSGKDNPPPTGRLSQEAVDQLKQMLKTSSTRLANVRVMGNEWDDYW